MCVLGLFTSSVYAKEPIRFCLAKDDTFPSSKEHKARMERWDIDCATVYWKLNAPDNRKHPYEWIRRGYLDEGYEVIMVLIIDDGGSTVAIGEDSEIAIGNLQKVTDGKYDDALRALAKKIAKDGRPIKIRIFPEFDGYWFPWGIYAEDNSVYTLIQAVAHVTSILWAEEGNDKIITFDANVNRRDGNGDVLNDAPQYTPIFNKLFGSYSISSYDRGGTAFTHLFPRSFRYDFKPTYDTLSSMAPNTCLNVAEVSTAGSYGRSKIEWFTQMLEDVDTYFPRICEITFFFGTGTATNGSTIDWSLDEKDYDAFGTLLKQHRNKRQTTSEGNQ